MNKVLILFVLAIALIGQAHSYSLKVENRLACGANEYLSECAPDRECDRTCANQHDPPNCMPSCGDGESRCVCIDTAYRNNAGQCVISC